VGQLAQLNCVGDRAEAQLIENMQSGRGGARKRADCFRGVLRAICGQQRRSACDGVFGRARPLTVLGSCANHAALAVRTRLTRGEASGSSLCVVAKGARSSGQLFRLAPSSYDP